MIITGIFFLILSFENVAAAAKYAMDAFAKGEVDAVELVYSEFKNAATQTFIAEQFLPVKKSEKKKGRSKS